jgi:hypothetical protein
MRSTCTHLEFYRPSISRLGSRSSSRNRRVSRNRHFACQLEENLRQQEISFDQLENFRSLMLRVRRELSRVNLLLPLKRIA